MGPPTRSQVPCARTIMPAHRPPLRPILRESRLTLKLALPLIIGQVSQMLLGVADTLMVGHLGVIELAALTFANSLFHLPLIFGIGMLTGVSVFTSNARGSGSHDDAKASVLNGLWIALALGTALFGAAWLLSCRLDLLGQPAEVSAQTTGFFRILMASIIPALGSIALKNHADALGRPWPPFWIFLGGVALNVFLNWLLIYGSWGCPKLGLEGAAWATWLSRWAIFAAMLGWLHRAQSLQPWLPKSWRPAIHFPWCRRLLRLGLPASGQMLFEVSAFSLAGLMMGRFGAQSMAAHQIAITLAGTAFMVPLGLSMALTVRMGEAVGAAQHQALKPIAISGWLLASAYALCGAIVFIHAGAWLAGWFVNDPALIRLTAALLAIVGIFQWADGLQVASSAMLRGLHDARIPALMGLLAYWVIGLPVGAGLAFYADWRAAGVWWGLAVGLLVACITLGPRLWRKIR